MSDTSPPPDLKPSNPRETVEGDGYRITFYPGFVRKLDVSTVQAGDAPGSGPQSNLYEQKAPFVLPPGVNRPFSSFGVQLTGEKIQSRVIVELDDPSHQVAAVMIRLKSKPKNGEGADGDEGPYEEVWVENTATICPPFCTPVGG